ncbi:hypothetical protein QYR09_11575 [Cellulophaga lytica]|nr:hypothetical protein QYR09_11575 [Cellulophaga lytica]
MKIKIILIFGCFLIIISCSTNKNLTPTYNKGGYNINLSNTKQNASKINIVGQVFDVTNGKPLSHSEVIIGCLKSKTSLNGKYSIILDKSSKTFFVKTGSIGYKSVETDFINLAEEDEITINFYLMEDDRPFNNCEGATK